MSMLVLAANIRDIDHRKLTFTNTWLAPNFEVTNMYRKFLFSVHQTEFVNLIIKSIILATSISKLGYVRANVLDT